MSDLRKYFISIILLLSFISGITQKQTVRTSNSATILITPKLNTRDDSVHYILGAFLGLWVVNNGFSIQNQTLFNRGLDDILQNRTRVIPDSLIGPKIASYQESLVQQKARQQEQLLFSTIKDKPGVGMFPNGVRYVVLKAGKGQRPLEADSIKIHLIAKLPDGTVVEDTYQTNKPFSATASSFFPGLNDALQNMPEGSKWQLFVPSNLAYADKGTTLIPPYSALILEVELLEVKPAKK